MRYSLKRKKLKYSLKFNTLDFNKIKILKFKKKKWFRLKRSFLRPKIEKKNKIKVFNVKKNSFSNFNVFIKRTFRENSLIIKRIRNIFMDYRRKSLRNFFLKNESLIFISQNKLKYVLKDAFFVESFYSAKQHIKHSRILVNNIKVSNPNYLLKNNDIVTLKNRGSSKIRINYFKKCWTMNGKKPIKTGLMLSFKTCSFNVFSKRVVDVSLEDRNFFLLRKNILNKFKYV